MGKWPWLPSRLWIRGLLGCYFGFDWQVCILCRSAEKHLLQWCFKGAAIWKDESMPRTSKANPGPGNHGKPEQVRSTLERGDPLWEFTVHSRQTTAHVFLFTYVSLRSCNATCSSWRIYLGLYSLFLSCFLFFSTVGREAITLLSRRLIFFSRASSVPNDLSHMLSQLTYGHPQHLHILFSTIWVPIFLQLA